jgi:hypothetical protein
MNLNRWFNLYSETSVDFDPSMLIKSVDKFEFFKNGTNFGHYDVNKKKYPIAEIDKLIGDQTGGEKSPRGKARGKKKPTG